LKRRPNILWIVTTQWRAQACGYAGDPNARTPVLDALAALSVNYAQAVTPHPFGPFARAALVTGVPSPRNGVAKYFDALPVKARTIAHDLRDRGYATAWIGKWHLGRRDPAAPIVGDAQARVTVPPDARGGFEFWEGFESGFLLNDPWLHGTRLPEPVQFPGYQPEVLVERAGQWWRSRGADHRPWFCVVSMETPHPPYGAPPADALAPDPESLDLCVNVPRGGAVESRARRELAGYHAHITATDRAIGNLWRVLEGGREHDATIVVFTSVHGDMHGAHGLFRKGWPHEESVRVPLLVRHPDIAAMRSDETVSLLDLPAMTRHWADGERWQCPRSHATISMPCIVPFADQCDRAWSGVRTPEWKVVLADDHSRYLCSDLRRDPHELGEVTLPEELVARGRQLVLDFG
jgi:arylsulfatase A-like enzyme